MSQERCAVPSCHQYRKEGRICFTCMDELRRAVRRLPELYQNCEEMLVHRRTRGIERIRGGTPGGVALDDTIVAARSEMLAVASSWACLVADERAVAVRPRRTVGELSRFLLANLRWLAGHTAVDEAAAEITRVVRVAQDAVESRPSQRLELGPCEENGCGAALRATIGAASAPTGVCCDNGHRRLPSEWLLLDRRLTRGRAGASTGSGDRTA